MRDYGITNVAPYANAPAVGAAGDTYFNTTTKNLYVSDGTAWIAVGSAGFIPQRIAYGIATSRDQTQGINVWCQQTLNLASQRLVKIEAAGRYQYVSTNMNVNCYLNLGYDLNRQQQMGLTYSITANNYVTYSGSLWAVLAAGSHTAEMHTVNNMTTGAMRFLADATSGWIAVEDWGPI